MNNFKVVKVCYTGDSYKEAWSSDVFCYKINSNIDVKEEDRVYIKNSYKEGLAKVLEIIEDEDEIKELHPSVPKRFLVLDLSKFIEAESKVEKIKEIESILDKKAKQIEKLQRYEILKNLDPSVGEILEELKQLKLETSNTLLIESSKEE